MNSTKEIPNKLCTWYKCIDLAFYVVKHKKSQNILGCNCEKHAPKESANDYIIESIEK